MSCGSCAIPSSSAVVSVVYQQNYINVHGLRKLGWSFVGKTSCTKVRSFEAFLPLPTDKYLLLSYLDRSVGLAFFFLFSAVFVTGTAHLPPIGAAVFLIHPGTSLYLTEKGVNSGLDSTGGSSTEDCRSNYTIRASYSTSLKVHLLSRETRNCIIVTVCIFQKLYKIFKSYILKLSNSCFRLYYVTIN